MRVLNTKDKHGNKAIQFPLASSMEEMRPLTRVAADVDEACLAYDKAFVCTVRYSGGQDLVEKIVAANFWPHGRETRPPFSLGKVKLPVFGEVGGVYFSRFGLKRAEGETDATIVARIEAEAGEILGDISEREYLARAAVGGTMPHLNQVFEELGVKYGNREVPPKILKSVEEKASKATASKNTTPRAESKKRKATSGPKPKGRKRRLRRPRDLPAQRLFWR